MSDKIPDAQLAIVEGAGHLPTWKRQKTSISNSMSF